MNPAKMNANRTARLAQEAKPRVAYTSETGVPTLRDRMRDEARARYAAYVRDENDCNCGDC